MYTVGCLKNIFTRYSTTERKLKASLVFALCVSEIRDKMQVVYEELTRDWIKSKVAKSQFCS